MKVDIPNYPRHKGPESGHLTECLIASVFEATQAAGGKWPINDDTYPYCTCNEETP